LLREKNQNPNCTLTPKYKNNISYLELMIINKIKRVYILLLVMYKNWLIKFDCNKVNKNSGINEKECCISLYLDGLEYG
jgi:hypothetical protein